MPSMLKDVQKEKQPDWQKDWSNEANSHFLQFCERAKTCSYFFFPPVYCKPFRNKHCFGAQNTLYVNRIRCTLTQVTNVPIFCFIWPIFIVTAVSSLSILLLLSAGLSYCYCCQQAYHIQRSSLSALLPHA